MKKFALLALGLALVMVGCATVVSAAPAKAPAKAAAAAKYPGMVRNNFTSSCESGCTPGATKANFTAAHCKTYCGCTLTKLEQRLAFDKFVAWDRALAAKKPVDPKTEVITNKAMDECMKSTFKR